MSRCVWYVSKYVITPEPGDPAGRAYGLMRELARQGFESIIITSDSMGKYNAPAADRSYVIDRVEGMTLCRARTFKYGDSNAFRRVLSWFDFERKLLRLPKWALPRPDVIVVSSLSLLTIFSGVWFRRRYKCRLIFEVRDIWPLTMVEEGGYSPRNPFVRILGMIERYAYRTSDAVLGTMPNLGEHVREVTGRDIPVDCVPMGVDTETLDESETLPPDYVEKYIPRDKFLVAYAGSIGISNALDVLFECVESMKDDDRIHFVVLGDGEMRDAYQSRFGSLGNLTFAPKIPKAQVQGFLRHCDLLYLSVHQSRVWDFGLSLNKLIDYMLAAKPILASYSGHPSMINEADCGTFVPAADPVALRTEILRYVSTPESDRHSMGERGRIWLLENRKYEALTVDFLRVLFPDGSVEDTDVSNAHGS